MTFNTSATDQGTFGQPNQEANSQDQGQGAGEGIDPTAFLELQKRDQNAQQHITTLEGENEGMRTDLARVNAELLAAQEKLTAQKKVEDLLKGNQTSEQTNQNTQFNQSTTEEVDFDKIVSDKLQEHFTEREQEANYRNASTTLTNLFKDKADEHVTRIAKENDMTMEDALTLSKTKPKLFENLFIKPYGQAGATQATSYTGNNTSSAPAGQTQITQEYWNEMRRNPKTSAKYWSPQVQKQYHAWVHGLNKQ